MKPILFDRDAGRLTAEEIFQANQHLFQFFQNPFFGVAIYSYPDKKWIAVNDTFCAFTGYDREEIRHLTWVDITHPDDLDENLRLYNRAISGIESDTYSMEKRFICKNGAILFTEIFTLCCRDESGSPDYNILFVQNISARKRGERKLLQFNRKLENQIALRTQKLKESEARLNALVDNLADGIISIDQSGAINGVNAAASRMFGYASEELVGQNVNVLVPAPHRDKHDGYLEQYLATGRGHVINNFRELEGQKKSGAIFPIELSVSDIHANDKRFFVGIVRDATERAALTKRLVLAREIAEKANAAKSDFLASMSHDFRTPLNAILGFAQLLQFDPREPLSEAQADRVDSIIFGGKQLLSLVGDVLDLVQIEAKQLTYDPKIIAPVEVVKACIKFSEPLANQKNIHLSLQLPKVKIPSVITDKARFEQIMMNIISNGIKFNSICGSIEVIIENSIQNFVKISVRDTGPGLPDRDSNRVFDMFYQGNKDHLKPSEGAGIGLAIVRQLIGQMGGRTGAYENADIGSTFWIELPVAGRQDIVFWTKDMQTGNSDLDKEHALAISMINELSVNGMEALSEGDRLIKLLEYTKNHFNKELELHSFENDEAKARHVKIHNDLREKLTLLVSSLAWRADISSKKKFEQELKQLWLEDIAADRACFVQ